MRVPGALDGVGCSQPRDSHRGAAVGTAPQPLPPSTPSWGTGQSPPLRAREPKTSVRSWESGHGSRIFHKMSCCPAGKAAWSVGQRLPQGMASTHQGHTRDTSGTRQGHSSAPRLSDQHCPGHPPAPAPWESLRRHPLAGTEPLCCSSPPRSPAQTRTDILDLAKGRCNF